MPESNHVDAQAGDGVEAFFSWLERLRRGAFILKDQMKTIIFALLLATSVQPIPLSLKLRKRQSRNPN